MDFGCPDHVELHEAWKDVCAQLGGCAELCSWLCLPCQARHHQGWAAAALSLAAGALCVAGSWSSGQGLCHARTGYRGCCLSFRATTSGWRVILAGTYIVSVEKPSLPRDVHTAVWKRMCFPSPGGLFRVFPSVFKPVCRLLGMPCVGCCVGFMLAQGTVGQAHPAISYFFLKHSLVLHSAITCEDHVAQLPLDLRL